MKNFFIHLRTYIFRGLLAIIPILLCTIAIELLYQLIDKRVIAFVDKFVDIHLIPGVGILLLLIALYMIGLIFSNVIGRQILGFIQGISERIPIIKAIYSIGKQLSDGLSASSDKQAFQKALLMQTYPGGPWTICFVTGNIKDKVTGEDMYKVFVPTVPHPLTGFLFIVPHAATRDPGWTVEEALKMLVSAGIISPTEIHKV